MLPGDAGIVQIDVRRLAPAQDVLPVGQGLGCPVGQGQVGPHLRLGGGLHQGADDPHQHQNGQNGKEKPEDQGVPGVKVRVIHRKLPQGGQPRLQGDGQETQAGPSFHTELTTDIDTAYYIRLRGTRAVLHKMFARRGHAGRGRGARGRPTGDSVPVPLDRKSQAQLRNRVRCNFCKLRAQWPGRTRGPPLRFCAPETTH